MMRWGFAALVLANIGLLMWATWYREGVGELRQPNPVFHPEQMVPLSAPGVALQARKSERPRTSLVAAKPRPRCVSIGPFATAELAEKAQVRLTEAKQVAIRRSEENKIESSYWVHLAPFANRQQAERRLKEVERLGIRDILIMPDADGKPAISLGLFTSADNAQKRLQELAQKGVQAQQDVRYRTERLSWFDLRLPEPAGAALERLRAIDWGASGVEVRDAPCAPKPG
jgi:hypothetical protein